MKIFLFISSFSLFYYNFITPAIFVLEKDKAEFVRIDTSFTITKNEEFRIMTPLVEDGKYFISTSGEMGDVDLYVKLNKAPTIKSYDCRPAKNGSNETCLINLNSSAVIYIMVRGYANKSKCRLICKKSD